LPGAIGVSIAVSGALAEQSLYGGYLVLTRQSDGQVFRVPYAGFKGDYQAIAAIGATFPQISKETALNTFSLAAPAEVRTLASRDEIPNVRLHFDHQVRRLELRVVDATTGLPLHDVFSNVYEQN